MLTSSIAWIGWTLSFFRDCWSLRSSVPDVLCTFLTFLRGVPLPLPDVRTDWEVQPAALIVCTHPAEVSTRPNGMGRAHTYPHRLLHLCKLGCIHLGRNPTTELRFSRAHSGLREDWNRVSTRQGRSKARAIRTSSWIRRLGGAGTLIPSSGFTLRSGLQLVGEFCAALAKRAAPALPAAHSFSTLTRGPRPNPLSG